MNSSHSPVTKEEKSTNGHHFNESNQSAFRRISTVKSEPKDDHLVNDKATKNGTNNISPDDLLGNKTAIPNPFLPPLLTPPNDFHSHLALLRPFLSQTLPFVPPLSSSSYWSSFPFLHPYLSAFRPPTFLPPPPPLSLSPTLSSSPPPAKASTSTNGNSNPKKPSAATHYHQYTITNNNVLVPSPATLIDFIRRPTNNNRDSTGNATATTSNPPKSKNVKKYKCDICSRAFSRSNTLVTHKRIHTGEKPFVCDICDRAFRQPGNLTRHKLTHTAAKPYACGICSKAFNRASNLHAHQRTHALIMPMMNKTTIKTNNNNTNNTSNGHGPYTCHHCHEVFEHKFEMNLHVAALHHSVERPIFANTREDIEVDDEDDDDDEEEEEKDEEMSENSDQDIDLLED